MKDWAAAVLFLGGVSAFIWFVVIPNRPPPVPLLTGKDCVEVVDRVFAKRKQAGPTPSEQMDMDRCGDGMKPPDRYGR